MSPIHTLFTSYSIIIIILSVKIVCLDTCLKTRTNIKFYNLIQVPFHDNYLIVLNSGLYLYDFKSLEFALLYEFNSSIFRESNNKINLTDLI